MRWTPLTDEEQVPDFIDAAAALHDDLLKRLPPADRPFFFDYWLRLLNVSDAYLHLDRDGPAALLTVPRGRATHEHRWRSRTLACRLDAHGSLAPPESVDLDRSFLMPGSPDRDGGSALRGAEHETVQLGYARSLASWTPTEATAGPWAIRPANPADVEAVLDLLGRSYTTDEAPAPDLARHRVELRQVTGQGAGWCYVAMDDHGAAPCAMASYVAVHVPLAGVPAALVADLAVEPAQRRRGLARRLQEHAWRDLRAAGVRWVFGNIDPRNAASCRQAESGGRTVWYRAVRFRSPRAPVPAGPGPAPS